MNGDARGFAHRLSRTPANPWTAENDPAAQAFAKRLAQRGIISDAVVADDEEPHHKKVLRILKEDREWQERYEAQEAEREALEAEARLTPAQLLAQAIGGGPTDSSSNPLPLNGIGVLRAALGGAGGTINGVLR